MNSYEKWWSNNLSNETYIHEGENIDSPGMETFTSDWMGAIDSKDRKKVRRFLKKYSSILDVGCGGAHEFFALKKYRKIQYTGVDITPEIVEYNKEKGINCFLGSANELNFPDSSFEVIHIRHVVEHMKDVEMPLNETIRVGEKLVIISFFIGPNNENDDIIKLDNEGTTGELYHNNYSKKSIAKYLNNNPKVKSFKYIDLSPPSTQALLISLVY
tara:strand:+ start:15202 stop:15846 length:645 start_codon:yes stop_codon:yes gene_type:complete